MKVTNKLSSLGISLDELYRELGQIEINLSDKPHQFHVVLLDRKGDADCKISSWSANLFARTNKGINREKYLSLSSLQTALVKLIKSKVDTNGDITFSISKEIHYM